MHSSPHHQLLLRDDRLYVYFRPSFLCHLGPHRVDVFNVSLPDLETQYCHNLVADVKGHAAKATRGLAVGATNPNLLYVTGSHSTNAIHVCHIDGLPLCRVMIGGYNDPGALVRALCVRRRYVAADVESQATTRIFVLREAPVIPLARADQP